MVYRVSYKRIDVENGKTFETEEFAALAADMCKLDPSVMFVEVRNLDDGQVISTWKREDIFTTLDALARKEWRK